MDSSPFDPNPRPARPGEVPTLESPLAHTAGKSRATVRVRATQGARSVAQPSYDFISGGPASPSPAPAQTGLQAAAEAREVGGEEGSVAQESLGVSQALFRSSTSSRGPQGEDGGLAAQLAAVKYELETLRTERELEKVRHGEEVGKLMREVEGMAREKERVEGEKKVLFEKVGKLGEEKEKAKKKADGQVRELERKVRELTRTNEDLADGLADRDTELGEKERGWRREKQELEVRAKGLSDSFEEVKRDFEEKMRALEECQRRLTKKEEECEELEKEVVRLKGMAGDAEALGTVKKELKEQVEYIRELEGRERKMKEEVRGLKEHKKSIDILTEENHGLQEKLRGMEELREKASKAEAQLAMYEEQRQAWQSYLEDSELNLETPLDLAKALMEARLQHASLLEKQGRIAPDLIEKDQTVSNLTSELNNLKAALEEAKQELQKAQTARMRLDRARQLAQKENGFLRDQLKSFSTEESLYLDPATVDTTKAAQITELESLLAEYKAENENLLSQIKSLEASLPDSQQLGSKRPLQEQQEDPRIGTLSRKLRTLQAEADELRNQNATLTADLKAAQLTLSQSRPTRILELKDNPTAHNERVKQQQLNILRDENAALKAQLLGTSPAPALVPRASLLSAQSDISALEVQLREKDKRLSRLKQIWTQKSLEFRQAVHSILGVLFDFLPNGKVRVSSEYWSPAGTCGEGSAGIVFDGEKGTMKIEREGGWCVDVDALVEEWVGGRGWIPGLVAALVMEGWETRERG